MLACIILTNTNVIRNTTDKHVSDAFAVKLVSQLRLVELGVVVEGGVGVHVAVHAFADKHNAAFFGNL